MECGICATRAHSSRGRGHTSITLCPRYTQPVRIISIHNYDEGEGEMCLVPGLHACWKKEEPHGFTWFSWL